MTDKINIPSIPFKHKDTCPLSGKHYDTWNNPEGTCEAYTFTEWLPHIAPDFFWFDIQDVGSYQGQVFGVAIHKGQIGIYEDYYGSCSGCGAWGEGGEPESQDKVVELTKLFDTAEKAKEYVGLISAYDSPNKQTMYDAIDKADEFRKQGVQA